MRPRVFPAEDELDFYHNASMRPRVFPAEDDRNFPTATRTAWLQ